MRNDWQCVKIEKFILQKMNEIIDINTKRRKIIETPVEPKQNTIRCQILMLKISTCSLTFIARFFASW